MKTIAILIMWWGSAQYGRFDVERFDSLAECEAARAVILADMDESWWVSGPRPHEVRCREVPST